MHCDIAASLWKLVLIPTVPLWLSNTLLDTLLFLILVAINKEIRATKRTTCARDTPHHDVHAYQPSFHQSDAMVSRLFVPTSGRPCGSEFRQKSFTSLALSIHACTFFRHSRTHTELTREYGVDTLVVMHPGAPPRPHFPVQTRQTYRDRSEMLTSQ